MPRRMRRPRSGGRLLAPLLSLLMPVVPTIVLGILGLRALEDRANRALARLTPVVASELSAWMDRPVSIGAIRPAPTVDWLVQLARQPEQIDRFPISIDDVALGARENERLVLGADRLGSARRIQLQMDARGIRGGSPASEALPKVRVEGLSLVLVRSRDGSWPITRIFPPDRRPYDPKRPPFRTRIEVVDGEVRLRDFAAGNGLRRRFETNAFRVREGWIDLAGSRMVRFRATGTGLADTPTARRLKGTLEIDGYLARGRPDTRPDGPRAALGSYGLAIHAGGVDLPYAAAYLPVSLPIAPTRGAADLRLHTFGRTAGTSPTLVSAVFRNMDFPVPGMRDVEVAGAGGTLDWAGGAVRVRALGAVSGVDLRVDATVTGIGGRESPRVRATASFPNLVPVAKLQALAPNVELPRSLRLPDRIRVGECSLDGPIGALEARATVSGEWIAWRGLPRVSSWTVPLTWRGETVVAGPIAAKVGGEGSLEGRVRWSPSTRVGTADLAVIGVSLPEIAELGSLDSRWRPGGMVSARARLSFRTGLRRGVPVSGRIDAEVDRPEVGAVRFDRAVVSADIAGTRIALRRARLAGGAGLVDATGTVDPGRGMRLGVSLVGFDAATLAEAFGFGDGAGVLSARLAISGPANAPSIVADDVSVLGPKWAWNGRVFAADAVRADRIRCMIAPDRSWRIGLEQPLRVSLYPAEIQVTGSLASGPVSPEIDLRVAAGNIAIERILPWIAADQAGWSNPWLRDSALWRGLAVDLGWISEPPAITGRVVEAALRVTGNLESPSLAGALSARRIRISDFPVESASAKFSWNGGAWRVDDLTGKSPVGELKASLACSDEGALAGTVAIDQIRLEALAPWTGGTVSLGGALRLKGTVGGNRREPVIAGELDVVDECSAAGLAIAQARFGKWSLNGFLPDAGSATWTARIDGFSALVAGAPLTVEASTFAWPGGRLESAVTWKIPAIRDVVRRISLAPAEDTTVGEWVRTVAGSLPDDVDARIDLHVAASGRSRDAASDPLRIDATLRGGDARLGPVRFDSVDAVIRSTGRRVVVERMDLQGSGAAIEGGGTVDLPVDPDGEIGFDLRLESLQPSLELVRAFDPDFPLFGSLDSVSIVAKGTTRSPKVQATLEGSGIVFKAPDRQPLTLDRMRVNARLLREPGGDLLLGIDDGLATHGDEEVRWDFLLPVDLERRRIVADRPIRRLEARTRGLRLATLLSFLDVPFDKVDGSVDARVAVEGTLNAPSLNGGFVLDGGEASFRRVGSARRAPVNALSQMRMDARFAGRDLILDGARIGFGPPGGDNRRSGGSITARGKVRLDNLEDFTRLFTGADPSAEPPRLRGNYDLLLRVSGLRPDVDNVTGLFGLVDSKGQKGLGEVGSGLIDGDLAVTGPLLAPLVSTPRDRPLRITELNLRLPKPGAPASAAKAPLIDPAWAVRMDIPVDARVVLVDSPVVRLEFTGRGAVAVSGTLSAPTLAALMYPAGGYLRYPLARLDLQRGGTARIEYTARRLAVNLTGVAAEGKITGIAGAAGRRGDGGLVNVGFGGVGGGAETTYRILATFNGAIDLGGSTGTDLLQQTTLQAQPDLTRQQILELLGARRQFDLVASGDTEQAFREFGKRFADAGLVAGLFRPLATGVRSAFGLDAFDMNYSLDGTAFFRVVRRLPPPVDRFTVEVSKSFTTRVSNTATLPFRFGLNYELFPLQPRGRFQPRLLLGVAATSEQRDSLSFVRGTVNY